MTFCFISKSLFDQGCDHLNHLSDMVCRPGFFIRRQNSQGVAILMKTDDGLLTQLSDGYAALSGTGVNFVIHIGDVAHIGHVREDSS